MNERILVVDDEPDIRNLVSDILTDEGYQVQAAATANKAREFVQEADYDLVLLDIWMPGEDGISLLKDWQQHNAIQCPIVMMSGHGTVETAVEATRLGAFSFVEKPLTTAKLISTIRSALDEYKKQQRTAVESASG
jgi:DNA-binding NtrC family response regulator